MHQRSFKPIARIAGGCLLAFAAGYFILQVCSAADEGKPAAGSDEAAIRAAIDAYVDAYNRGDAKTVASFWAESGEWIGPSGEKFAGRKAIEKEMESLFDDEKGAKIEVINPTVRVISADTAIEEGTVRVTHPSEPPTESTYIAVDVKEKGKWKLNTVRETDLPEAPAASSQLDELAWLVGDWVDDSPEADEAATISWTKNKTFLKQAFKASTPGMDDLEGTQVIGWDAAAGTIRSWMFDTDGGFGEGTWTKHGDSWVVKFNQVLPDGRRASATNVYTILDGNSFAWKSIGRKVDGEFLPNVDEVKMVRKSSVAAAETDKPAKKAKDKAAKKGADKGSKKADDDT